MEFWVKEKKMAIVALPGKGSHSSNVLKTVPSTGKKIREFYSKKEKNMFSDRNQDWGKCAFFLLWGEFDQRDDARSSRVIMLGVFWVTA